MKRVLVVGDIILDRYTIVTTDRMAQEADIPVYDVDRSSQFNVRDYTKLGGAANVAANIKSLGGAEIDVVLAGITKARTVNQLTEDDIIFWVNSVYGDQLEKHRYVYDDEVIFRIDNKKKFDESYVSDFEKLFKINRDFDMVVISDYDKGTVTEKVVKKILRSGIPTVVDSKAYDLCKYAGARVLNINEEEYSKQVSNKLYTNVESLFDYVLVTLGDRGSELRQCERSKSNDGSYIVHAEKFPTRVVDVVDVTGCGDTHTAAFVLGLLRDPDDVREAVRYANVAATIAVQKLGTSKVSRWDMTKELGGSS